MMAPPNLEATAIVPFSREELFDYLADLENHWALADRFIEVVDLNREATELGLGPATGGRVRMRGPLGISRTARTRVLAADAPSDIFGSAQLGRRTLAIVSWTLVDHGEGTLVRLPIPRRAGAEAGSSGHTPATPIPAPHSAPDPSHPPAKSLAPALYSPLR